MRLLPTTAPLLFLLAACAGPGDGASAGAPAPARTTAATTPPAPAVHTAPTTFVCDGGHRVDLTAGSARVTLADGRVVDVPADGAAYRGEALAFVPAGDHGTLSQDEVGAFACRRGG